MYKQCRTEQSAARQRQLEEGLLQLMLRKRFDEFSVSDLCEYLHIPRKSFYRYFSSKDGALCALIDHTLMDCDIHTARSEPEKQKDPLVFMTDLFSFWVARKPLLDALQKSGITGQLILRALAFSSEVDRMPAFLQITDKRLREYGSMFAISGLMAMIVRWHHDGFFKTPEEMAKLSLELFGSPMFSVKMPKK